MKKWGNGIAIGSLVVVLSMLTGCAKVHTTNSVSTTDITTESTIAGDVVTVNNEFGNAVDDAVAILCNPDTTILNTLIFGETPTIYDIEYGLYNSGLEADGTKERIGQDSINFGAEPWKDQDAKASFSLGDDNQTTPEYEVAFITNNSSLALVGDVSLTNVWGGLVPATATDSLVVHVRASVKFTYNDQTTGAQTFTWYFNQIRTYTRVGGNLMVATRGDSTVSGTANSTCWGTTRLGTYFCAVTVSPVVRNITTADLSYNPLSGKEFIEGIPEPINSVYGVNSTGAVVTSGTPYGFYFAWSSGGTPASQVTAYYY